MSGINRDGVRICTNRKLVDELHDCTPVVTMGYLERAGHCVKLVELDGRLSGVSENGLCALEIEKLDSVIGVEWWELWPEYMRHVLRNAVMRSRLGEVVRFVGNCPTKSSRAKLWHVKVTPIRNKLGRIVRLLVVAREMGNSKTA